jgi:PD-(D/E)XK nuclease superfamily
MGNKLTPGVLDLDMTILPLKSISPSRYEGLLQCALREVWSSGKQPSLLPISPAARLGSTIHRLFEEAGSGLLGVGDQKAIELRWAELVRLTEEQMRSDWLARHLVPLQNHVLDFEVRKIRAWSRAFEISSTSSASASQVAPRGQRIGTEMLVNSKDGRIVGRIDRVIMSNAGPVIIDYKSGAISEYMPGANTNSINSGYVRQLHLYAALYETSTGIWPVQLQLVPLSGPAITVEFDRSICSQLLDDAMGTLNEINHVIASSPKTEVVERLANPSPGNCRFCTCRPSCRPYHQARIILTENREWPSDVWGILADFRKLGNSKLSIEVQPEELPGVKYHIRGLNPDVTRHPAIALFQMGDRIALYNLSGGEGSKTYSESNLTTIYWVMRA